MLHENIKACRKAMRLTQEQLAEIMGVTVGAVSKWESGQSNPDIMLLPKLAKLFGVSIDVLFSFELTDRSADDVAEEIKAYRHEKRYDVGSEIAESAIRRYPNHFGVIYQSATLFMIKGFEKKEKAALETALELYRRCCPLIGQNRDERISELSIQISIGETLFYLNRNEEALEHLKKYNYCGIANSIIGEYLSHGKHPQQALPYLSECLLDCIANLMRCSVGFANVYVNSDEYKSANEVLKMMYDLTTHLKKEGQVSYIDKLQVMLLATSAQIHSLCKEFPEAVKCLERAHELAKRFDASPDYNAQNIKFYKGKKQIFGDDAGETAMECIERMIYTEECGAEFLQQAWQNITGNGKAQSAGG